MSTSAERAQAAVILAKIRRDKELAQYGYERDRMSPELAEALRKEIRTALDADGGPFDVNVARRVYDLAIAARDMCVAATSTTQEAIDQIKDTNGPMETLDSPNTPESQMQVSETFGARLLRELMGSLSILQGARRGGNSEDLVHALAEARRNGMHDVAEQLEVKLFGHALSGPRPIVLEEAKDDHEHSFTDGFADGHAGALSASQTPAYHEGYLKGMQARYLDKGALTDHSAAIARDISRGLTSHQIRDEIIRAVGMTANMRTPEMQARYEAALKREGKVDSMTGPVACDHPLEARYEAPYDDGYQVFCRVCGKHVTQRSAVDDNYEQGFADGSAGRFPKHETECYREGYDCGLRLRGENDPSSTWVCGHGRRFPAPAPGFSMSCHCQVTASGVVL